VIEFRILGPVEAARDGHVVALGGVRPRAVLALLVLHAGRTVSRDRLVDELWGEVPPATARNVLHNAVADLRRALEDDPAQPTLLETRAPGYVLHAPPGSVDLHRFESLLAAGREALEHGDSLEAHDRLSRALACWRGDPLADMTFEPWATPVIRRLEELRMIALEALMDARLALGGAGELVAELENLADEHPLREGFRCQLLLALYRSGRQVEALESAREWRRKLVHELGLEPGPRVRDLEQRILRQDEELAPRRRVKGLVDPLAPPVRSLMIAVDDEGELSKLLDVFAPRGGAGAWELIVTRVVARMEDLQAAATSLHTVSDERGGAFRSAAIVSHSPGDDLARLARDGGVEAVLVPIGRGLAPEREEPLRGLLAAAACDVAAVRLGHGPPRGPGAAVLVPFGGGDQDWAALELGAWLAAGLDVPLSLFGVQADGGRGDASRLLATASLVVQRFVGVPVIPAVGRRGPDGVADAASTASLVVAGLSERWQTEGIGEARRQLLDEVPATVLLVRRGIRPGALAPPESLTRFTWSLGALSPAAVA
jgi:DNA-binding SARP family transcriptional activator